MKRSSRRLRKTILLSGIAKDGFSLLPVIILFPGADEMLVARLAVQ
jgi:hypothetical protein